MTTCCIHKLIYSLLLALAVFTYCNGQANTPSLPGKASAPASQHTGQPKLIKTQGSNEYQHVRCAIQDKNGNIWFGTTGEGVYKYDGKLFTQFTAKDGLTSNHVWSILEDKTGRIWFGTSDGICRYDGNKIIPVTINFSIRPVIDNESYYTEWSTKNTVWSMLQDKHGKIWFGTGDGVYCYDGKYFTRFLADDKIKNKDSLQLKLVSDILQDKNGNIWFASGMPPGNEGFSRYDGKQIENFKPKSEGWIRNVIESNNGNLLLATRHYGVLSYDGTSFTDYAQPGELVKASLSFIAEDKAGNVWIASDYGKNVGDTLGGLWYSRPSVTNPTEKTFTKITNREVYFIFEDKDNNIWFSTRGMGLYRYDGKTLVEFSQEKK